jgi:hypothetical protein
MNSRTSGKVSQMIVKPLKQENDFIKLLQLKRSHNQTQIALLYRLVLRMMGW